MDWLALPRPAIQALRAVRTGALIVAGGIERFLQTDTGSPIPPLWLLRQTGPVLHVESSATEADALIGEMGLAPNALVVDAGCGFGAMAPRIGTRLGSEGRYIGFDVHGPSIRWAQRHLASADVRLRFVLIRRGPGEAWPAADRDADFVLAKSLFTHLPDADARGALHEVARCLRPGGRALVTAFLFESDRAPERLLPYPAPGAPVRWRWKHRPEAVVAYERTHFSTLIEDAGLRIAAFRPGFWPRAEKLDAQDVLFLEKASESGSQ